MKNVSGGVLYFGSYDPKYSRNFILKKGLESNRVSCFENKAKGFLPARYFKLSKYFFKHRDDIENILVGFPGYYDLPLAFLLGKLFR